MCDMNGERDGNIDTEPLLNLSQSQNLHRRNVRVVGRVSIRHTTGHR
jgi:hypothetical protein